MLKKSKSNNQVVTFGCRLNAYESEAIKAALEQSAQENLIVFNSCAVTNEAERELRQAVRKARKNNPEAKIVVTGCAAQIDPQKYAKMTEVDLVLGNAEKSSSDSYLKLEKNSKETPKIAAKISILILKFCTKTRTFLPQKKMNKFS
jgi:threonylcarbamoyladenosine tRNA methylthiotransferase MtaB